MIRVTCFKCTHKFSVDEEALLAEQAATEGQEGDEDAKPRPKHLVVECPFCRKINKVSLPRPRRRRRRPAAK